MGERIDSLALKKDRSAISLREVIENVGMDSK